MNGPSLFHADGILRGALYGFPSCSAQPMAWVLSRLLGRNQECLRRSKTCLTAGRPMGFQGRRDLICCQNPTWS